MTTLQQTRALIVIFMAALVAAGVSAFPLEWELPIAVDLLKSTALAEWMPDLTAWLTTVRDAVLETGDKYPFLAYGTDWLAYAHLVIAILFVGPFREPVRNVWIVQWAMIACVAIIPVTLIAGAIREIPFFWQLIDMSFGVFGLIPLLILLRLIRKLEREAAPEFVAAQPIST